jgi:hypothetical protein
MEPLVAEIMRLIEARADDPRLRWSPDRMTVRMVYSRLILDEGPMPAARLRRARFGEAWRAAMAEHGWVEAGHSGLFTHAGPAAPGGRPRAAERSAAGRGEGRQQLTCRRLLLALHGLPVPPPRT